MLDGDYVRIGILPTRKLPMSWSGWCSQKSQDQTMNIVPA